MVHVFRPCGRNRKGCTDTNSYWSGLGKKCVDVLPIMIINCLYCVIGGAIFEAIERPAEMDHCNEQLEKLAKVHEIETWNEVHEKHHLSIEEYDQFFQLLTTLEGLDPLEEGHDRKYNKHLDPDHENNTNALVYNSTEWREHQESYCEVLWTFEGAVYFCFTVVSTIGYGNIAPTTDQGRIFFLFYCIPGIGIFGALLTRLQSVISHVVDHFAPKSLTEPVR